jgi:hypothetical protein
LLTLLKINVKRNLKIHKNLNKILKNWTRICIYYFWSIRKHSKVLNRDAILMGFQNIPCHKTRQDICKYKHNQYNHVSIHIYKVLCIQIKQKSIIIYLLLKSWRNLTLNFISKGRYFICVKSMVIVQKQVILQHNKTYFTAQK